MASSASPEFALNPRPNASFAQIGSEGVPVLRFDNLMHTPDALVEYAAGVGEFEPAWGPGGGYPGVRAPAPLDYVETVVRAHDPVLRRASGIGDAVLSGAECSLSLVTLPEAELVEAQREPHIDTTYPYQFAFLHYLCGAEHGGTSFFRHRATGFETLSDARLPEYESARSGEGASPGYVSGSTDWFEEIAAVDAAFDRLVIYPSRLLHSGRILPDTPLSGDPRQGRPTANIFVTYRAAA